MVEQPARPRDPEAELPTAGAEDRNDPGYRPGRSTQVRLVKDDHDAASRRLASAPGRVVAAASIAHRGRSIGAAAAVVRGLRTVTWATPRPMISQAPAM